MKGDRRLALGPVEVHSLDQKLHHADLLVATFPGLLFGTIQLMRQGNQSMPYGPALALGVVLTLWLWPFLGESDAIRMVFSDPVFLGVIAGGGAFFLLFAGLLLRFVLGTPPQESEKSA